MNKLTMIYNTRRDTFNVLGKQVHSRIALEDHQLDYGSLMRILDGGIESETILKLVGDWKPVNGECDTTGEDYYWYIITESDYWFLQEMTEDPILYSEEADMYVWLCQYGQSDMSFKSTGIDLELIEI